MPLSRAWHSAPRRSRSWGCARSWAAPTTGPRTRSSALEAQSRVGRWIDTTAQVAGSPPRSCSRVEEPPQRRRRRPVAAGRRLAALRGGRRRAVTWALRCGRRETNGSATKKEWWCSGKCPIFTSQQWSARRWAAGAGAPSRSVSPMHSAEAPRTLLAATNAPQEMDIRRHARPWLWQRRRASGGCGFGSSRMIHADAVALRQRRAEL